MRNGVEIGRPDALAVVEEAMGRTAGHARKCAEMIMGEVDRLALLYARAIVSGAASGRYAPSNLMNQVHALIGTCGMRGEVSDEDYASALTQRYVDMMREEM